jgi:hypothetical protein
MGIELPVHDEAMGAHAETPGQCSWLTLMLMNTPVRVAKFRHRQMSTWCQAHAIDG